MTLFLLLADTSSTRPVPERGRISPGAGTSVPGQLIDGSPDAGKTPMVTRRRDLLLWEQLVRE
jgi:hypothetical protein